MDGFMPFRRKVRPPCDRHLPGPQTGTCQGRKPAPDRAANRRPPDHDQHTRDPYHKSESSKRNQLISIHNLTNLM